MVSARFTGMLNRTLTAMVNTAPQFSNGIARGVPNRGGTMVHALKILLIAGAALAPMAMAAQAADLDQPIFVEQAPDVVPVEIGNGWYIRGDISYSLLQNTGVHEYDVFTPPSTYSAQTFATADLSNDISFGGGVGYQFTDWLRVDGTIDVYRGSFTGTTVSTSPCPGQPVGTTCSTNDSQGYDAYQFMANAYADLGTFVGFTPYVGAGAGMTMVEYGTLTNQFICADPTAPDDCVFPAPLPSTTHEGASSLRFTYSVMAGVSYSTSKNVKLDLGYRYSKVAGGDQFYYDAASQTAGATGVQGVDNGYDLHEVRLGLRYALW
jgi:opacity protein-like surface antigen